MDLAESALLPRVHITAHAQISNSGRACGGAEIHTHFLLDVKETLRIEKTAAVLIIYDSIIVYSRILSENDGKLIGKL
jgi:hypothetical protein